MEQADIPAVVDELCRESDARVFKMLHAMAALAIKGAEDGTPGISAEQ